MDLVNTYSSVPQDVIGFAIAHFRVPDNLREVVGKYYSRFNMHFTTRSFTTSWQSLIVGIPMGRAISSLLFVPVMQAIIRGVESHVEGIFTAGNQ